MATVVVTGLIAVAFGVPTANVEGALGPHRAVYSVSIDHEVRISLGPLGSIAVDSPLPWPLGARIDVREIPAGLSGAGENAALALSDDLDGYLRFFTQPDLAVEDAARALATDALGRVALAWSVLLVLAAAARLASRDGALRVELRASLAEPGVAVLAAAAVVVVVVVPPFVATLTDDPPGRPSTVLAGTPLADARIVGRVGDLLDTYGVYVIEAVEENRIFYDTAAAHLAEAYAADPDPLAPAPDAFVTPVPSSDDGATAGEEPTPDGTAAPGDAPAVVEAAPSSAAPSADPEEVVTLLLVSDLHCNTGMATVIGEAVGLAGAQAVLNAGDTVISGTTVEQFCVDALAGAVPRGVPIVVADGNHDSEETAAQERRAGNVVLDGEPVEVAGVRILGDAEPTLTTVTEGTRLKGDETRTQVGRRLAARACDSRDRGQQVDILLVHNPRAGVATMETGCVPLQLSGHLHRQIGPTPQGLGLLYVSTSTAGATLGGQTIGPLQAPGTMTVLRFDPVAHRPLAYRLLTIGTDASALVGPWLPFPEPAAELVQVDLSGEVADY